MVSMACQGQSNTAIASALGVARKTIIRWHKLPHIIEAIAQASSSQTEAVAKEQGKQYQQITKTTQVATTELQLCELSLALRDFASTLSI